MRNRHDPVDHVRTHYQRAGQSMVDTYSWPGFVLLAVGIIAVMGAISAAAYQRHELLATIAPLAFITVVAGSAWIAVESRRPRRIEALWHSRHGDRMALRPTHPTPALISTTR